METKKLSNVEFYRTFFTTEHFNITPDIEPIDICSVNKYKVVIACRNINTGEVFCQTVSHAFSGNTRYRFFIAAENSGFGEIIPIRMLIRLTSTDNANRNAWRERCWEHHKIHAVIAQLRQWDVIYNATTGKMIYTIQHSIDVIDTVVMRTALKLFLTGVYKIIRDGKEAPISPIPTTLGEVKECKGVLFDLAPVNWSKEIEAKGKTFEYFVRFLQENNMLTGETLRAKVGGRYLVFNLKGKYTLSDLTNGKDYTHYVLNDNGITFVKRLIVHHKLAQ